MTDVFDVSKFVSPDIKDAIFVLKTSKYIPVEQIIRVRDYWDHSWTTQGYEPPFMLFLPEGLELQMLTEHQLTQYGLKRILQDDGKLGSWKDRFLQRTAEHKVRVAASRPAGQLPQSDLTD